MVRIRTRPFLGVLPLFVATVCLARAPQGSFQRTLQVNGPVDLQVQTHSGDIIVRSGPSGTVSISAKIYVGDNWLHWNKTEDIAALEKDPPVHQTGNSIRIDYPGIRNVAIDFEITVPADTSVRAHSGSGDQTFEGLRANLDLESGSGDMTLRDLSGDVRVHTGSGNIQGQNVTGSLNAEAGSGDIRVEARDQCDVRVHTGSGNIELHDVKGSLRAEAGSGDMRIDGSQAGMWEVRTGSGNVNLSLPNDAAFDLNASTSSGSLVVDHPVAMMVQGDVQRSHREINGKVHGGGPTLTVHTGSGDIHIL